MEIPDDIDRTATDIVQMRMGDDPEWETYVAIARAILAERKRCAGVARSEAENCDTPAWHILNSIAVAIEAGQ